MPVPAEHLEEGTRVRVPWGRGSVEGTVVEVYRNAGGRRGEQPFVRVALELGGVDGGEDPDEDGTEIVALPATLLEALQPAAVPGEQGRN